MNYHPNLCSSHLSFVPNIMLALHDQQTSLKPMKNSGAVLRKSLDTLPNTSMNSSASVSIITSKVGRFQAVVDWDPWEVRTHQGNNPSGLNGIIKVQKI